MYRKFKGSGIFNGNAFLHGEHVLITDLSGSVKDIVAIDDAGPDVEMYDGLLCPGFINCHCHIELSHLKGRIPSHTGLVDFVQAVMANRAAPDDIKRTAMEQAQQELFESGTVAVGDICNNADSVNLKKSSPLYWNNFIEVSGFVDAGAGKRLADAEMVATEFASLPFPYSIVPHAPYSVSKTLFELLNQKSHSQRITIHNQEEETENELYKNKTGRFLQLYKNLGIGIEEFAATGCSSFQTWQPYFTNNQTIISVHNTFISEEDLAVAKNTTFCICINANLYIENTVPPVGMLYASGLPVVLGTDSYASNWQLNMLEEMKSIQKYFPNIPTEIILQWATMNGAKALGITNNFGSFTNGSMPGVVLIEKMDGIQFSNDAIARRLL